jgi:hypothetical protein
MSAPIAQTGLTSVPIGENLPLNDLMVATEPPRAAATPGSAPAAKLVQSDFAADDPYAELESHLMGCRVMFNPDSAIDDLARFALNWEPDLVIWDPFCNAGMVAAQACGAAHARMLFGSDGLGQLRLACLDRDGRWPQSRHDPLREWLQPALERWGCEFAEEAVLGDWTIFPMPPWIWRPAGVRYVPVRHVPFNGPSTVPPWVDRPAEGRRVCVTLGLSHRDRNFGVAASASSLFEAVAGLDVEVVATLSASQLEPGTPVPDNVRVVEFVPLNALLPTCSAIVHCGGAGTFAGAVENGVPQLIVPNTYWSEKWWGPLVMANGIEEQRAGIYVGDADQVTAGMLHDSLSRVLKEPQYAANAARLAAEVAGMPSPNEIVPALERLTREHQRGRRRAAGIGPTVS